MITALTSSNTDLERFAYIASHDLQEPLRMITNFTQLLQDEYGDKLNEDARLYIKFACDAAIRMQSLVSGLLEYSRVSGECPTLDSVDLNIILDEVKENLMNKIDETNAFITRDLLPIVKMDKIQALQLFQNLLTNAMNYQKAGNTPKVHIASKEKDDVWEISVCDNGIGIDQSHLEVIFAPFKRLHSYADYKGTGIGLSVCKKIVENMGGTLSVISEKDKGSTFLLQIQKHQTKLR